jgi:transmembrane protein TMEM260 (protein O-mannosyltransferase)
VTCRTAPCERGFCCCAASIQLDARADSYPRRQRGIDRGSPGAGSRASTGFPLWVMLAHLASLVPLGNVAVRTNFSSALFAALACAMPTLLVAELMIAAAHVTTAKRNMGQLVGRCDGQNQVSRKLREASDVTLHNPSANNLCEATALAQPSNLNKADEIPRPANRLLTARRCTNADSPRSTSGQNCSSSS